ncbi:MAG TPA: histidine--tRNA ligase [Gammaproteobacteria bacterium]|nr:histidine--tRNA ligase [Gammaproteobacteria bacterium]
MSDKLQAIRGMHDILPADSSYWRQLENIIIDVIRSYDYIEIRLPIVEKTELFARSIGESSDIVSKEMYTFADRNDDMLTLRPEGTAGCVRAGLEHGLFHNQIQKLWYMGPMFRHERPQKGRQRQFHQIGLEVFGLAGPDVDAEMIILCARIWQALQLTGIQLELNTLGTATARANYREVLKDYLHSRREQLDEDSLRRLEVNPLRILDSKNPAMQAVIDEAPAILDYLDAESEDHFSELRQLLDTVGITYHVNPQLVRGLDYYGKTVFEWTSDKLGAQATVCAGGRYDGLVEQFGGRATPAIGCAMGLERLIDLVGQFGTGKAEPLHACLLLATEGTSAAGLQLAETLRNDLPGLRLQTFFGGGSLKSQFRRADKSGALLALVLGADELSEGTVTVKSLRDDSEQVTMAQSALADWLAGKLSGQLNLA